MFHGTQSELGPGWWLRNAGLLSVRDSGPQGGAPGGGPGLGVTVCGGVGCRVTNKGFCRLSTDCHPELLPPLGAGWRGGFTGRAQRAGGLPASSQAGRVSARGGPGSLPEGPPLGFPDEETEARGRRQGLGSALGFAALSGRGACCLEEAPGWLGVCVCGGGCQAWGRGDPSLSHGVRPSWVAGEGLLPPPLSPTSMVSSSPGSWPFPENVWGPSPTCRGWTAAQHHPQPGA